LKLRSKDSQALSPEKSVFQQPLPSGPTRQPAAVIVFASPISMTPGIEKASVSFSRRVKSSHLILPLPLQAPVCPSP
jgi:hypothetical protein